MKTALLVLCVLALLVAALLELASRRWRAATATLVARLDAAPSPAPIARFAASELEGLPPPVVRYFRAALREGQPTVRRARLRQRGEFLVKPETNGWAPFEATQEIATRPPGFVWNARIRIAPGLAISVRDGFVDGRGRMIASMLGLIPLVRVEGTPEIAAGALHRYLAEAAWFPTALLPSAGVVWSPLGGTSARATLEVSGTRVWLDFHFGADELVERVYTPERMRDVNGRALPTPWQGRWFDPVERDGMRVPSRGEVEWLLPEGAQPYWRGRVESVDYTFGADAGADAPS